MKSVLKHTYGGGLPEDDDDEAESADPESCLEIVAFMLGGGS